MYQVNSVLAAHAANFSSKQYPALLEVARLALDAQDRWVQIKATTLEAAINEAIAINKPGSVKLAAHLAAVR